MITEQLIVDAAKEVLETTSQAVVNGANCAVAMESHFTGVVARLSIVGQRSAELVMLCSLALANSLTAGMLGLSPEEVDEALISDALGELVNQVGGTVKRRLASEYGDMVLSVPSVIRGDMHLKVMSDQPPVCVDLQLDPGPMHVRVWTPKREA